jgi:hypothetical protein
MPILTRFGRDARDPGVQIDAPAASGSFCLAIESNGMRKSELIKRLATAQSHLHLRDIERIVDTMFEQIGAALPSPGRNYGRGIAERDWVAF